VIWEIVFKSGGRERAFSIEADPEGTVLDLLETMRKCAEPGLLYRHSCHHGSCGTCGAMINGKPKLMCLTALGDLGTNRITLEPLAKETVIGDVAVWPGPLFEALPDTDYLRDSENSPGTRRLEACIECGICSAACPVAKPFIGPAALAAAAAEMRKHPASEIAMGAIADAPDGAAACERAFECSRSCPQGVAPGRRITELLNRRR
jgi:succinate dehydrogenase / fumarate reductase iron-sulfur subunit